jgi:hypothetical protein
MIKGFLKNAGNILKVSVGVKNLASKLQNHVFVFPRKISLGKQKPDGVCERPLRAITMQGPRVSLAKSDTVAAGTELKFEIKMVDNKEISADLIKELLAYGELCGLGQWRSGSYGRFIVKEFEVVA